MGFNLDSIRGHSVVDDNGCWIWQRAKTSAGYGMVCGDGSRFYTHRVVAELTLGPCPPGVEVMHSCDVPACCNPDHLSYGTRAQNVADMHAKGRHRTNPLSGEAHGMAKLSEAQVIEIRRRRAAGDLLKTLAAEFGVTVSNVHLIVTRQKWRHVE